MTANMPLYARVILDSPLPQLDHPFDYAVPESLLGVIAVGQRVSVPLRGGRRRSDAWVIELTNQTEFAGSLSPIDSVVSPVPQLPASLYALARAVADRQAGSLVDVLRLGIPSRYVRTEQAFVAANPVSSWAPAIARVVESPARIYLSVGGGVRELSTGGWVPQWATELAQRAMNTLDRGDSAILVVPDFRDVGYLEQACVAAGLSERVVRVDANQSGQQRWHNYLRLLSGDPAVVIGNRSAVYAPVNRLGLIGMWDDGNDLFHEPLAPYAHPRDVALVRQQQSNCDLLFAAQVPSPATARLVSLGFLTPELVGSVPRIVPTDAQSTHDGPTQRIPAVVYTQAREALAHGPVLIHVAKPGFASSLRCAACGERALCAHCGGPLRQANRQAQPSCRWCSKLATPFDCSNCHGHQVRVSGGGAEKVGDELGRAFPGARVIRADGDNVIEHVSGVNTLVIATPGAEPIAAGGYAGVFILDGETTRSRDDLDADIDALRAWAHAAGLADGAAPIYAAGTGALLGRVVATSDYDAYVKQSVSERELLALPPVTRVAIITGSPRLLTQVRDQIEALPHRSIMGPTTVDADTSRLILTFDYRDGATVASGLRALVVTTAQAPRKPVGATEPRPSRVSRLSVRMDDAWHTLN